VAFFTPEIWTRVAARDTTGRGRSLDARPAFTGGLALEVGNTPMLSGRNRAGVRYRRIPRLTFPMDPATRRATLQHQVRYYSKAAF